MFVSLTRTKRLKAGRLLALVYLLCVVAPSASFAFANGARTAHCLTRESLGLSSMQMHMDDEAEQHVHNDGAMHDHSSMHAHMTMAGSDSSATQAVTKGAPATGKAPDKSSDAQCCSLLCLTAMPATLMDFVIPPALTFICASEPSRNVTDNAPTRHYRPPIS
ncbi:MAG: hypothetical protein EKK40_09430 [Bradyrhizobiaceae bacterium]|nr:MAG: hypothetical protein EKK40_09430 [Bradyrhizobiaceae bacterium]